MFDNQQRILAVGGILFVVLVIALVIYTVFSSLAHGGTIKTSITVYPEDATVTIDGQSSGKTAYLKPGSHTFIARKTGFKTDVQVVMISGDSDSVTMLPEPVTDKAKAWAASGDVQARREALGGSAALERGNALEEAYPLIKKLPYFEIAGPFAINYGFYGDGNSKVFFSIDNSSPNGRAAALQWIRDQGSDPTTLDLRFSGYTNPVTGAAR